jgi:hypothetical protein
MDAEPETLDPHEVKVLADILALVLEDQSPASAVALETVRRKARQHRVTGGALKNLFQAIATSPMAESGRRRGVPAMPETHEATERLRAANRSLERALAAANGETARLQADLEQVQARLVEAHQHSRGLADRWRSGQRQTGLLTAGIVACLLVIAGLLADRLLSRPALELEQAQAPPAAPSRSAAQPPPAAPSPHVATLPGSTATADAGDPELDSALRRLSQQDQGPAAGSDAAPATLAAASGSSAGTLPPEAYRGVIEHVRACWRGYVSKLGDAHFQARLQVVTDESGVVRDAKLAPDEAARLSDPAFRTYVEAAMRAVLEPDCAQLPIPPANLGHKIAFDFVFVP